MSRHKPRGWPKRGTKDKPVLPDPYSPTSPGYAERNRQVITEELNGTVRVDMGAPLHRLPCEPQPIVLPSTPAAPAAAPEAAPQEPEGPGRRAAEPDLKPGLGKR
ncbi:hypothetical protein ACFFF7_12660 [Novosphingobium aquiterrae]|uniref:Uncharacterized protein n=1 Tax=Novosphingobium aquiterrae TaxID=624388 RepID=A0ABV6PKA3_9SPHN